MSRLSSVCIVVVVASALACSGGDGGGRSGTLVSIEQGDIACYVTIENGGTSETMDGDFELCPGGGRDASGKIGKQVTLTTEKSSVQAASCQGDPECTATETVDLVTRID
jgi:hypothetical protein